MVSPWRSQLPLYEYATSRVVVYFYSDRWIPIMFYSLGEAIALHRNALLSGQEILVFPPDLDPCGFQQAQETAVLHQAPRTKISFAKGRTQLKTAVGSHSNGSFHN